MGLQGSAHVQYPLVVGLEVILPTMFGLREIADGAGCNTM